MNARKTSELVGITYGQLRYFVEKIDALTKKETSQGHDHEFGFRDLVYLKLAAKMREDGLRLPVINDAIELLDVYWTNAERPATAGTLSRISYLDGRDVWAWGDIPGEKFFFIDENGETGSEIITHSPGSIYSVAAIASELADDNQLELEFNPGKEVYEETQVK